MKSDLLRDCETFYKLAAGREAELESLLQESIRNMDNASYQVFLDLLEEERPKVRNQLIRAVSKGRSNEKLLNVLLVLGQFAAVNQVYNNRFSFPSLPFTIAFFDDCLEVEIAMDHVRVGMRRSGFAFFSFVDPIKAGGVPIKALRVGEDSEVTFWSTSGFPMGQSARSSKESDDIIKIINPMLISAREHHAKLAQTFGL